MATDKALIEKREELKRRLAAGEYKTLIDVFLERLEWLFQKITRRPKSFPKWFVALFFCFFVILIGYSVIYVSGELNVLLNVVAVFGLGYQLNILLTASIFILYMFSVFIINHYINRVFYLWRDHILDATETLSSLDDFEDWLNKTCNRRRHFFVTLLGGLIAILPIISNRLGVFHDFLFTNSIGAMFGVAFVYQVLMVLILYSKLQQYTLKLFPANPSSSPIIFYLSRKLGSIVYFAGFFAAIVTLVAALGGILISFGFS